MKYKRGKFLQLSRGIFKDESFISLSINAKWLYVVLAELEHRFTGPETDTFYRSNEDLCLDAGLSLPTLKRAKKEIKDSGLVKMWLAKWDNEDTGKKSERSITYFKVVS